MSWKSEFKEQLQLLEGNPLAQGDESLLLCYALENEIIPEDAYMAWAQKHTLTARITPAFFSERAAPVEVFQKYREKMPWSKALLPVGEWDGHLLIAGVLAPKHLPAGVIFFYASPSSLLKFYDAFFGESSRALGEHTIAQVQTEKPAPEISINEHNTPALQDVPVGATPELVLVDGDAFESEASGTEPSIISEEDSEEKLDLNFNSVPNVSIDFTQLGSPSSLQEIPLATETKSQEVEPELSLTNSPPPYLDLKIEFPSLTAPDQESDTMEASDSTPENEITFDESSPPEVKATPTLVQEKPVSDNSVVLQTPTGIKGKNQVGYYLSQWSTKTLSTTFKESFEKMKTHFDRSLVLSLSDDEKKAKVLFWDSLFQEPMQDFPIDLQKPSIFYIAAKTAKPFHGPISINEENERFFEAWNRGKIPAHTTLIPIIVKDQVVALLMGVGESSAYNRATLHFAEKMGSKISETLQTAKQAA